MNHYFKSNENLRSDEREIKYIYKSTQFSFITDSGVFSRDRVDYATNILLENLPELSGKILDIGCGFGCVGIVLAKIYENNSNIKIFMSDVNTRALELTKKNAEINGVSGKISGVIKSDGFENICGNFDFIISNPPIRAGKNVIYKIYEEAYANLNKGGGFFIVIQKKHGALSHRKKLGEIFGEENIKTIYSKKNFFVFELKK
ncbi:MAG: methyltransferase [Oscillospiraceae bacterium]|nr:methyltransferase [Oscillospiraceae bacterium]